MTDLSEVKRLLDRMDAQQRRNVLVYLRALLPPHPVEERLMISAEGMLDAIDRAGDFTVRMIRGVFAEAAFATDVLPRISDRWRLVPRLGDPPYDFLLTDIPADTDPPEGLAYPTVRMQVKMQRSKGKNPLYASDVWKTRVKWPATHFVVELQKSRKGERNGELTRPYRFGEFDLVAVSLGPSRGRWGLFTYTVARWLLPDPTNAQHILLYQPVSPDDNDCWTSDFDRVVEWLRSGVERRIEGDVPKAKPHKGRVVRKRRNA